MPLTYMPRQCIYSRIRLGAIIYSLDILYFYVDEDRKYYEKRGVWIALAHVCRRWRSLVFQSPRRLNLRLICTPKTRVRNTLDIWPPLPLVISDTYDDL